MTSLRVVRRDWLFAVFTAIAVALIGYEFRGWWLNENPIALGDWQFVSDHQLEGWFPFPSTWRNDIDLGGYAGPSLNWMITFVLYGWLHHFGLHWPLIERLIWFWPTVILSFVGMSLYTRELFGSRWAALAGGVMFALGSYPLSLALGLEMSLYRAMVTIPLCAWIVLRYARAPSLRWALAFLLSFALLTWTEIRMAFVGGIVCAAVFFTFSHEGRLSLTNFLRMLLSLVVFAIVELVLNAYWILPVAWPQGRPELPSGLVGNYITDYYTPQHTLAGIVAFATTNGLPTRGGSVPWLEIFVPAFAVYALVSTTRRRAAFFCGVCWLIGSTLAKGANAPLPWIDTTAFAIIPGFSLFRDPSKWYPIILMGVVPLAASTVENFYAQISSIRFARASSVGYLARAVATAVIFAVGIATFAPASTGPISGGALAVSAVPSSEARLNAYVESDRNFGRVLWFPVAGRYASSSSLHPVVSASNFVAQMDANEALYTANFAMFDQPTAFRSVRNAGIAYFVIPTDEVDPSFYFYGISRDALRRAFDQLPWLKRLHVADRSVAVWRVLDFEASKITTHNAAQATVGGPAARSLIELESGAADTLQFFGASAFEALRDPAIRDHVRFGLGSFDIPTERSIPSENALPDAEGTIASQPVDYVLGGTSDQIGGLGMPESRFLPYWQSEVKDPVYRPQSPANLAVRVDLPSRTSFSLRGLVVAASESQGRRTIVDLSADAMRSLRRSIRSKLTYPWGGIPTDAYHDLSLPTKRSGSRPRGDVVFPLIGTESGRAHMIFSIDRLASGTNKAIDVDVYFNDFPVGKMSASPGGKRAVLEFDEDLNFGDRLTLVVNSRTTGGLDASTLTIDSPQLRILGAVASATEPFSDTGGAGASAILVSRSHVTGSVGTSIPIPLKRPIPLDASPVFRARMVSVGPRSPSFLIRGVMRDGNRRFVFVGSPTFRGSLLTYDFRKWASLSLTRSWEDQREVHRNDATWLNSNRVPRTSDDLELEQLELLAMSSQMGDAEHDGTFAVKSIAIDEESEDSPFIPHGVIAADRAFILADGQSASLQRRVDGSLDAVFAPSTPIDNPTLAGREATFVLNSGEQKRYFVLSEDDKQVSVLNDVADDSAPRTSAIPLAEGDTQPSLIDSAVDVLMPRTSAILPRSSISRIYNVTDVLAFRYPMPARTLPRVSIPIEIDHPDQFSVGYRLLVRNSNGERVVVYPETSRDDSAAFSAGLGSLRVDDFHRSPRLDLLGLGPIEETGNSGSSQVLDVDLLAALSTTSTDIGARVESIDVLVSRRLPSEPGSSANDESVSRRFSIDPGRSAIRAGVAFVPGAQTMSVIDPSDSSLIVDGKPIYGTTSSSALASDNRVRVLDFGNVRLERGSHYIESKTGENNRLTGFVLQKVRQALPVRGSISLADATADRFDFDLESNRSQWIQFHETYHPGWNAYADGIKLRHIESEGWDNAFFLKSPGRHRITISFDLQPVFEMGFAITVIGLLGCATLALWEMRRSRVGEVE